MPARAFGIAWVVILTASFAAPQNTFSRRTQTLLYTVAHEYDPLAWMRGADRFPGGATIYIKDANGRRGLIPGFLATADASVSFDGSNVLFAGKQRKEDRWQIWEAALTAGRIGKPRQVTQCADDCVRPLYVPPDRVPPDRFVYAHRAGGKFVLEISALDASDTKTLTLTHGAGNFLPVDVLRDGRVLFEGEYPSGDSAISELYTVYSDGSGVEAYRCDHGHSRYSGKQLSSGDIVFAREAELFRFTSALAHEVEIHAPAGSYAGDVIETSDGAWLVSWHSAAGKNFELRKWKPGVSVLQPEIVESGANVIQPVLLAPRPVPNRHPSGLHDWTYANVLCLNAYISKFRFAESAIASVRVYTRDAQGTPRILGTAQVEKDGSFYLRVPGDQPLKIELLDQSGNTLRKEAGWFWLRGGEQRICAGCHAGPETSPENAVPAVLLRSTIPADMTASGQASSAPGGH